jgi:hypothetical protein
MAAAGGSFEFFSSAHIVFQQGLTDAFQQALPEFVTDSVPLFGD